jgi:hypothetical protein
MLFYILTGSVALLSISMMIATYLFKSKYETLAKDDTKSLTELPNNNFLSICSYIAYGSQLVILVAAGMLYVKYKDQTV